MWMAVALTLTLVLVSCRGGQRDTEAQGGSTPAGQTQETTQQDGTPAPGTQTGDAAPASGSAAGPTPTTPEQTRTTPSGLQYVDLREGTGASPQAGQRVTVHYTGWLTDGSKFDSSVDRGQPFPFVIGRGEVIPGWDEGVMSMKVGGKRKLIIPPGLGYGERGFPGAIPPNSTLVFEVELLGVQ